MTDERTKREAIDRTFLVPLLNGGLATVRVPVPMSEADFAQLTGTLQIWKPALVGHMVEVKEYTEEILNEEML